MNFEKHVQKEYRFFHKSLLGFIILVTIVLAIFVYWLQLKYDFFNFL